MAIGLGSRVGPYEVTAPIGEGGMGKVWRAHHTALERDDALKVLPDAFASDPDRLARFRREAQVLASLNHPNIAHVYGLEQAEGVQALVMELVEGPTLANRIAQGPIPVDEALPIARQIAEALETAHEQGIVHRDLKPANIKVRADGAVKVLDFGLAKAFGDEMGSDLSNSPTVSLAATRAGVILGTAAYMSPEQAKGKPVDKRSDVWAFGCVLYEMLTGKRAFEGTDLSEVLAGVIKSDPNWDALPSSLSSTLRTYLRRCLQKDPKQRVHDIADVRLAMEGAFDTAAAAPTAVAVRRLRLWQRPAAAALIALSLAATTGLAVWALLRPGSQAVVRFPIPLGAGEGFTFTGRHIVAISPDGSRVVYTANQGLSLRRFDQLQASPVSGTEAEARSPFFSPDGQWIGFWAAGQLKKVSVTGGAPVTLCDADNPWGASWGAGDTVLYGQGPKGIWRVPGTGGTPELLISVKEGEVAHGPQMLPGGEWVLFTLRPSGVSEWDQAQIVVQSLETGERNVVMTGGRDARYVPTGHLVYALNGVLLAVPFDLGARRVAGGPVPLVEDVSDAGNATGAAQFSVASNGSLIYVLGIAAAQRTLVWVDRQGREELVNAPPRTYFYPRISPDGTRVALDIRDQENDIWIWDLARETLTRFTFDAAPDFYPAWTPDGRRLVWQSSRAGPAANLFWQASDGTGSVERLTESANMHIPYAFSPDGTRLLFAEVKPTIQPDLALLAMEGEPPSAEARRQAQAVSTSSSDAGRGPSTSSGRSESVTSRQTQPLVQTTFSERNGEISPDGRWVAYESSESGQSEIYVRPFPDVNSGRWQISTGGGTEPSWTRNGKELFYVAPSQAVMNVPVDGGATFRAGNPIRLFEGVQYYHGVGRSYDVSPDGQRFLMVKEAGGSGEDQAPPSIIVVEHWFEELKRLVPVN